MANINLRPWREELRQKRNQEFDKTLFLVLMLGAFVWWNVNSWYDSEIKAQQARNKLLDNGMIELDKQIAEIRDLTKTKDQLKERLKLIKDLQGTRPVIVRVFDELVATLPEDLYFSKLIVEGDTLQIEGKAKNNGRISELMRNFDESEWFDAPLLGDIVALKDAYNEFSLTVKQKAPQLEEDAQ